MHPIRAKSLSPKVGMARNSSCWHICSFGEHASSRRDRTCCPGLKAWCIAAEIAGSKPEDRPRTRHDPAARPELYVSLYSPYDGFRPLASRSWSEQELILG